MAKVSKSTNEYIMRSVFFKKWMLCLINEVHHNVIKTKEDEVEDYEICYVKHFRCMKANLRLTVSRMVGQMYLKA